MTELATLEHEIGLARSYSVPVLITGPFDVALAIAHAIAGTADDPAPRSMLFDGTDLLDSVNRDRWDEASTSALTTLIICNVQALSLHEQAALLKLLEADGERKPRRVIATASESLFDQVQLRKFLPELFYKLNVIHIVGSPLLESGTPRVGSIIAA